MNINENNINENNMNINEILFSPPFCLDIFKVIYNNKEFLFIGKVSKEEFIIINKIKDKIQINNQEKKILIEKYGKTALEILKKKINSKTIFIQEIILLNDNIKTIKEKIFYNLSQKHVNEYLDLDKQYLFTRKILDYSFITSIIPNLFINKKKLTQKDIIGELSRIMDVSQINFAKNEYTLEDLQDFFTRLVNTKLYIYHDVGLSQTFLNQRNNKMVCEYVDITKNNDTDNDYNSRIKNNDFIIFNSIINQTKYDESNNIKLNQDIYLFYLDDISKTKKNYNYIIQRYFSFVKKNQLSLREKKNSIINLEELYEKQYDTLNKIIENMKSFSKQMNIINYVKLKKKNIIKLNIDLPELYEKIDSSIEIPFINLKYEKKARIKKNVSLFKIHKPVFHSRSQITSKTLDNWKNGVLDMEDKEYDNSEELLFREKDFIHMVIKYEHNYITLYLSNEGNILTVFPIIKKNRKEKMEQHFFKYMSRINSIISMINNILNNIEESNTPEFKNYDLKKSIIQIDETNIKNIKMNFTKSIMVGNIPNLNTIFQEMKLFFYSAGKNRYGLKNVNNFGTDEYIVNYIIDRFFQDNDITLQKIIPEIIENFDRNPQEIENIYKSIDMSDEKILKKKRNNNIEKAEVYFYNDLGKRKTKINFTSHNINQLVFVNNLINLLANELSDFKNRKKIITPKKSTKKKFFSIPRTAASNSNNNNNNNSDFLLNNNDSNNNSNDNTKENNFYEEENNDKSINNQENIIPEKIDDLDYKNLSVSQYFRNMRKKYDDKFFKENSNYTRTCPAKDDRMPIIVSTKLWEYIAQNKRFSDGLDKHKDDDIDTDKYRIITGTEEVENAYICPRIYCVRCMVPIKTDEFIENDLKCPFCNGKPTRVQGVKGKFTNENTVKIRGNEYWKNNKWKKIDVQCGECLKSHKYIDFYKNDYKCIYCQSENVQVNEDDLIPFLVDIKNKKLKIPKILENSLSPMYPRMKQGSSLPCCDKSSVEKKNKENKEDYFKDSGTKLSHDELGLLTGDLNDLLNNNASVYIKQNCLFVKTETNKKKVYYKYKFYENEKILAFDKKKSPSVRKVLFRLGTNNILEKNSFILAVYKLKSIKDHEEDDNKTIREPLNMKKIMDNIDTKTFASINNGNLYEKFRLSKNSDNDLEKALQNFKDYSLNKNEFKDYTYYIDLLGKKNILFNQDYNIIVIEKDLTEDKNIKIECPLFNYDNKLETIFIIKFIDERKKIYFEPIVKINLSPVAKSLQFSFKEDDPHFANIFKIINDKCIRNLINKPYNLNNIINLVNQSEYEIKFHIINKHYKVIGVVLNNNLFIPILPSGIIEKDKILSTKDLLEKENLLKYSEFISKRDNFLELLKKKNITVYDDFLQESKKTYFNKKINGIITKDELFIPISDTNIKNIKNHNNQIERIFKIDNLIYNQNNSNNNRKKKIRSYYNNIKSYNDYKVEVNKYIIKNNILKKKLRKIISNPVMKKKDKKELIIVLLDKEKLTNNFTNKLLNELLDNTRFALKFLNERYRIKKSKGLRKNNVKVLQNDFNNLRRKLYNKKKLKYERDIKHFNTKKMINRDIGEDYKLNNVKNIANTPISYKKSIKIKKNKNIPVPDVNGTTIDMFGFDRKDEANVTNGKCVLPFKTRYNSYVDRSQTQAKQNIEYFYDCFPTNDGPICPTEDLGDEIFKRKNHKYSYCNYNDYFDRQEKNINKKGKKIFNKEECIDSPIFIKRKTKGGITDNVKINRKCLINQHRTKKAFDKKNPSETFKCLKKSKKGLKIYSDKHSADCFIDKL